jgi:TolB-like protein/Tfp pilus assembly protein PilF
LVVDSECAALKIRTLGAFQVERAGVEIPDDAWPRNKTRDLFKVLLTAPGDVFTVDQLIESLLPDAEVDRATSNIRARVSELRGVLEPDLKRGTHSQYIKHVGEGYAFRLDSDCWVDAPAFESGLAEAHRLSDRGLWEEAVEAFEDALALYHGDFLAEDRYAEWAEGTRRQLRERHLEGLTRQAACYAELGRLRQAISCCQRILSIEPYRESAIRSLMEHQSAAGQRGRAIETYQEGERALREHLDVEPAPETRAAYERIRAPSVGKDLDPRRIAVLPFVNYSPDPEDEYFADGMTEELIGSLAKVRDLRVIARTSVMRFKGTKQPVSEVARALDVGSILEGSVRKAGDRVRISAQLIDARTEEHLWADEYEGDIGDVFAVQRNAAREVAQALRIELASGERQALSPQDVEDVAAHTFFLKGRFFQSQRQLHATRKARDYLERATHLDPSHARAYAALADAYAIGSEGNLPIDQALQKAQTAVNRALQIDANLAEAHTAQALILLLSGPDVVAAKRSLDRAIGLNPSSATALNWQGVRCNGIGQYEQAAAFQKAAISLDPLSPYSRFLLARTLVKLNRFDEALDYLDQALEIDPTHWGSMGRRIWCHHLLRNWDAAEIALEAFQAQHGETFAYPRYRGLHLLYLGRIEESHAQLVLSCDRGISGSSFYHSSLVDLARQLLCARRFEESIEQIETILSENPSGIGAQGREEPLFRMAIALEQLGRFPEALSALAQASDLLFVEKTGRVPWIPSSEVEMSVWVPAAIGMVHAVAGNLDKAHTALDGARTCPKNRGGQSARAVLCFRMGLLDEGFEALDLAIDNHDWFILTIKTHPWFDPVRDDPRFVEALKRMNLSD